MGQRRWCSRLFIYVHYTQPLEYVNTEALDYPPAIVLYLSGIPGNSVRGAGWRDESAKIRWRWPLVVAGARRAGLLE